MKGTKETAVLGGGCFWCLEAVYEQLRGVESVVSGYAGGHDPRPTYESVCDGATGHAEVVRVTFDPAVVSFRDVLEVFFTIHDPTTVDRQGNDEGVQYRSIILHASPEQKATAEDVIRALTDEKAFEDPIVTQVEPLTVFHPAEPYHQGYYRRNPTQGYCRAVISPKLRKFREKWSANLKAA